MSLLKDLHNHGDIAFVDGDAGVAEQAKVLAEYETLLSRGYVERCRRAMGKDTPDKVWLGITGKGQLYLHTGKEPK